MDTQLENNYAHSIDFALQLTINSGFLGLNDLYNLSKVDKFMNSLFKKNIEKFYEILTKCSEMEGDKELMYSIWDNAGTYPSTSFTFDNIHPHLFCKKLNRDEMAIYYSYFVFRYHKFYRTDMYSKFWRCILYENGYIKIISDDYNIDRGVSETDIILNIEIHYSYLIWRNHQKKLQYWGTKLYLKNKNGGKEIKPEFVNLKLLDKLIKSEKYQGMISKNFL